MSEISEVADDELLSELLDSALGDFKATDVTKSQNASTNSAKDKEKSKKAGLSDGGNASQSSKPKKQASASSRSDRATSSKHTDDDLANMESMLGGLASALGGDASSQNMEAQFGALMQLLKQEDPTLFNKFQTLNERATKLDGESSEVEFANILQDTLSYLNDGLNEDNESRESNSERTASAAGAAASANDDDDDDVPLANLEQFVDSASEMMRSLLARSVFYPLVKSLTSKYPEWIATHRAQLDSKAVQNHERQCAALCRIRDVYERSADQSELLSAAEFDSVIGLLREAQSFGDPPRELLDESGSSTFSALGRNACVVM